MSWLEFLLFEDELYTTTQISTTINVGMLIIAFIINLTLTLKLYRIRKQWTNFGEVIVPVFYINLMNTFRFLLSIINHSILIMTDQERSLNGFYESCMWIFFVYYSLELIKDSRLFYIGKERMRAHRIRILAIKLFILVIFIVLLLINFVQRFFALEIVLLSSLLGYAIILIYTFRQEINNSESTLVKLRFHLYSLAWIYFILYLATFVIGFTIQGIIFPDTFMPTWFSLILYSGFLIFPLIASFMFYWSIFTPNYYKKKFGLVK